MKHSNYVSLYLANRSSNAVSATYKLFIHNQETNEDEIIFTSAGVKLFDTQGQGRIDGWGTLVYLILCVNNKGNYR